MINGQIVRKLTLLLFAYQKHRHSLTNGVLKVQSIAHKLSRLLDYSAYTCIAHGLCMYMCNIIIHTYVICVCCVRCEYIGSESAFQMQNESTFQNVCITVAEVD